MCAGSFAIRNLSIVTLFPFPERNARALASVSSGVQCQGPANHGSASCLPSEILQRGAVLGARFGNATLRLGRARSLLPEPLSTRSGSNGFKRRDGLLLGASENLISACPGVQAPASALSLICQEITLLGWFHSLLKLQRNPC
jgi:hypothetical protein